MQRASRTSEAQIDFLSTSRRLEQRLVASRADVERLSADRRRLALDVVLEIKGARDALARLDADLARARHEFGLLEDARPELERRRLEAEDQSRQRAVAFQHAQAADIRAVKRREAEKQIARFKSVGDYAEAERWQHHLETHPEFAETTGGERAS